MSTSLTSRPVMNKNYTITNNSGEDIVVLDAFSDAAPPAVEQLYEQSLKILPTADGKNVIKAGETGVVVLNDTHKDSSGEEVYSKLYNLIIAKAGNLYPVESEGVMMSFSTQSYTPLILTADSLKNMQLAENFHKTIMAYPASTLSKNYQAAASGAAGSATSGESIDNAISTFFKSTTQYKAVTLNMTVAVSTYYNQFPFVWADYKSTKTYYLYSSDGTTCTYSGSVTINVPSTVPASTDKSLPGCTFTFTDASGNAKNLFYTGGQFVDDANSDTPNICLKGMFTLKSQLTKNAADNIVIAILSGTVNNSKVMGYDVEQKQDSDGNWSGLYTLLHPKDAMGWMQLFMTMMGVLMGVDFVYKSLKSLKDMLTQKKVDKGGTDPSASDIADMKTKLNDLKKQADASNQKLLDKMNDNLKVSDDLNTSVADLQTQIKDRLNEDQRSSLEDTLSSQEDMLEQIAATVNDGNLDSISDNLSAAADKLDGASTQDLDTVLPEVKSNLSDINTSIKTEMDTVSSQISDIMDSLSASQQDIDDAADVSDTISDNTEDAVNGDLPEELDFA